MIRGGASQVCLHVLAASPSDLLQGWRSSVTTTQAVATAWSCTEGCTSQERPAGRFPEQTGFLHLTEQQSPDKGSGSWAWTCATLTPGTLWPVPDVQPVQVGLS